MSIATETRELVMARYDEFMRRASPDMDLSPPDFTLSLSQHGKRSMIVRMEREGRFEEGTPSWGASFRVCQDLVPHIEDEYDNITTFFDIWLRLERRSLAIGRDMTRRTPPLWSLRMNRVLRLLVQHATGEGIAVQLTRGPEDAFERRSFGNPAELSVSTPKQVERMSGDFRVQRDRFDAVDEIEFGEQIINGRPKPMMIYRTRGRPDTGGESRLIIDGLQLPETMVSALCAGGYDLGEVISHPAFKGPLGVKITEADQRDGRMIIRFENVEDWLAKPPEGAETNWMRLGSMG